MFTDLDSVGGELNAYTNKEEIGVHASFRKGHFSIAADLLSDIIQRPAFDKKEIAKEKDVVLDEISSYLDNPGERVFDEFEAHLFDGNSLGYNILGTRDSVSGFTQENLFDYVQEHFHAKNAVVSFVGDIELDEVKDILQRYFGSLSGGEDKSSFEPLSQTQHFDLEEAKANYQAHIVLGGPAPSYKNNERRALSLLMNVLGGPALNARLNLLIREQHGYAYTVETSYNGYADSGFWTLYMGTDKKNINHAIELVYQEFNALIKDNLSTEQLIQAKEQLKGHIALSLDSNLELMFSLGKNLLLHDKGLSVKEVYDSIDTITESEIHEVLKNYLDPNKLAKLIYTYK